LGAFPLVQPIEHYIRAKAERNFLEPYPDCIEEEDLFASVWKSAKNRWLWLSLNLCFAFFASRVIGGFEDTIVRLVALAALMPIVAIVAVQIPEIKPRPSLWPLAGARSNHMIGNVRRVFIKELSHESFEWHCMGGNRRKSLLTCFTSANMALGLVTSFRCNATQSVTWSLGRISHPAYFAQTWPLPHHRIKCIAWLLLQPAVASFIFPGACNLIFQVN
jgi:hypothetical protein